MNNLNKKNNQTNNSNKRINNPLDKLESKTKKIYYWVNGN